MLTVSAENCGLAFVKAYRGRREGAGGTGRECFAAIDAIDTSGVRAARTILRTGSLGIYSCCSRCVIADHQKSDRRGQRQHRRLLRGLRLYPRVRLEAARTHGNYVRGRISLPVLSNTGKRD
jgi:hypothetical protein